jgi:tetratricopeptide (TPR) repeat protein
MTSGATGLLRWPVVRFAPGELRLGPPESFGLLAGLPTGRLCLGEGGRTLAVVSDGEIGRVAVLDLRGRDPPIILAGHAGLERVSLSPDGRWLATGTWQGNGVKVWDLHSGALARDVNVQGSADVLFSPDGRSLVTASGEEYAVWNLSTWMRQLQIPRSRAAGFPGQAAFSPAGDVLAIAKTRSLVQLVDAASGRELATLEPPEPKNVSSLRFSADGQLLLVALQTAGTQVWDLGAIRRGLDSLGLNWSGSTGAAPVATSALGPREIIVEDTPWAAHLARGDELARFGQWDHAAAAFEAAITAGARHVDAQTRRVLLHQARGDQSAYRESCGQFLQMFEAPELVPRAANEIAWACALGPAAVDDYARVVHLAESAVASRPLSGRLNTLGAILYRAGRFEEAIRQLERAIAVRGDGATPHDALFLAMAHHRLGHVTEARHWLRLGTAGAPDAPRATEARGDRPWIASLEIEILRREALALIEPSRP